MRFYSSADASRFRASLCVVGLLSFVLFALRLRSYSRPPTVPVVILENAKETTYTFESFRLPVPHNAVVVECNSNHGEDRLRVSSSDREGSMEVVIRGIHGSGLDQEDREWQASNFSYHDKPPFRRSPTLFQGKQAIRMVKQGDFVSALGRNDGRIKDMEEIVTIVAWRGHILGMIASFQRSDTKARDEANRLLAHLKLRDTW